MTVELGESVVPDATPLAGVHVPVLIETVTTVTSS